MIQERVRRPRLTLRTRRAIEFYIMVSPWAVLFLLIGLVPLLWGFYLSLTNFSGFNFSQLRFLGLYNYESAFADSAAVNSMVQTFIILVIYVPFNTVLGFSLALLMNMPVRARGIFRTIFYLPSIIPAIVTGLMWQTIFAYRGGLINQALLAVHLPPENWEGYSLARWSLIMLLLWGAGGSLLINLAGLRAVPKSFYEAAIIDGARPWQQLVRITIPLMTPIILFNVIIGMITTFQVLVQPILLTPGENSLISVPLQPIYLYVVYAWNQIFANDQFGYGLALFWLLFVLIFILTVILLVSSRLWVYSESEGR